VAGYCLEQKRINALVYLALYLTYDNSAQFGVLWGFFFFFKCTHKCNCNCRPLILTVTRTIFDFRGFLHRDSFLYFLAHFLTEFFFIYDKQISAEEVYFGEMQDSKMVNRKPVKIVSNFQLSINYWQ
jgi:hypothetical protein